MRRLSLLLIVFAVVLTSAPLSAQHARPLLPAPVLIGVITSGDGQGRGKLAPESTAADLLTGRGQEVLYGSSEYYYIVQPGAEDEIPDSIFSQSQAPCSIYNWDISSDRKSIYLWQECTYGDVLTQIKYFDEYSLITGAAFAGISDLLYWWMSQGYQVDAEVRYVAGVNNNELVVGDLARQEWHSTPLERWLPRGIAIVQVSAIFDPLQRWAFAQVEFRADIAGIVDNACFLIDLTTLDSEPVLTDFDWVEWSPDGQYAAAYNPDGRLLILDGASLSPIQTADGETITLPDAAYFYWHPDGETAIFVQRLQIRMPLKNIGGMNNAYALYRLDLVSGAITKLIRVEGPDDGLPDFRLGGGGRYGLLNLNSLMDGTSRVIVDLQAEDTGEAWYDRYSFFTSEYPPVISPRQDWFISDKTRDFRSAKDGIRQAEDWDGSALVRGWAADGTPIIQVLESPGEYDSELNPNMPEPGWYLLDMDAEGNLLWERLPCEEACNVIPPEPIRRTPRGYSIPSHRPAVAQNPDDPMLFVLAGSSVEGDGLHLVNLRDGTAGLVQRMIVPDDEPGYKWDEIVRIEWLAPGSFVEQ